MESESPPPHVKTEMVQCMAENEAALHGRITGVILSSGDIDKLFWLDNIPVRHISRDTFVPFISPPAAKKAETRHRKFRITVTSKNFQALLYMYIM